MKKIKLFITCAFTTSTLLAALEPISPVGGATVSLVPDAQKKVMNLPTLDARIKLFQEDRTSGKALKHDPHWRKSLPFVLEVKVTQGENGPWKVMIGRSPDLSDARIWYLQTAKADAATGREGAAAAVKDVARIEVPRANLEIATRYYWKVVCRGRCGFGCGPKHGCKDSKRIVETPVSEFVTEDFAPRWIALEGRVANIRDFGGRFGLCGRRVRQGMIYRGQGLNDNSVTGEEKGLNRLTVEDVKYLTGTLGIRTDLDLRSIGEIADMKGSPLGEPVNFIWHSSSAYKGIFSESGMKTMAKNFRVFCDKRNYPVYFHCIGGADRTGSLAYVMNGVLGVSRHEMETDWESTFYPRIPDENGDLNHWCRESHFNDGIGKYGDADTPWNERVALYLKACGITDDEIRTFREIMLEAK
ncbi:MAG: tyrosine-protein phosphatase [bacterium]|nr:tyrosine-protein phosphatase [Candidatus Colisoma equi]